MVSCITFKYVCIIISWRHGAVFHLVVGSHAGVIYIVFQYRRRDGDRCSTSCANCWIMVWRIKTGQLALCTSSCCKARSYYSSDGWGEQLHEREHTSFFCKRFAWLVSKPMKYRSLRSLQTNHLRMDNLTVSSTKCTCSVGELFSGSYHPTGVRTNRH